MLVLISYHAVKSRAVETAFLLWFEDATLSIVNGISAQYWITSAAGA